MVPNKVSDIYHPSSDDIVETVDSIISRYPDKTGLLLNALNDIQGVYRHLPQTALALISEKIDIPLDELTSMAEFFDAFSLTPTGKYIIEVCDGTCCHLKGAPKLLEKLEEALGIKEGEVTDDEMFSIRAVNCVGACGVAPVIACKDRSYGCVKITDIHDVVVSIKRYTEEASLTTDDPFYFLEQSEDAHE